MCLDKKCKVEKYIKFKIKYFFKLLPKSKFFLNI